MLLIADDVLHDVLLRVPRHWLDQLPISNGRVSRAVARTSEPSTTIGPRRLVTVDVMQPDAGTAVDVLISTCDPDDRTPALTDFDYVLWPQKHCYCPAQLHRLMKDCIVVLVTFERVDPGMIGHLSPLAHRWLNAVIAVHAQQFDSSDHFARFFDELTVTTHWLIIDMPHQPGFQLDAQRVWTLEGVNRCGRLSIDNMPPVVRVTDEQIVAWLKVPHERAEGKLFEIHGPALAVTVDDVMKAIKSDFETASERRPFRVVISWPHADDVPWIDGEHWADGLTNDVTGEELLLELEDTAWSVRRCVAEVPPSEE